MRISDLQQFLRLLAPPLAAAGINASSQKNITAGLESLAGALEPFGQMTTEQLADVLKVAHEYGVTGQLPEWVMGRMPKSSQTRTPKPSKAPAIQIADVVAKLRDLQERSSDLHSTQIAEEVRRFASLTGPQLKEVQREFLGAPAGKTKSEQLAAIQKKIDNSRASRDRVKDILAL